jgi:hypothetical protein
MKVLGVYSADLLPTVDEIRLGCRNSSRNFTSCCFAVNTDPSSRPGKHWVLFIGCRNACGVQLLEYFDSYGMPMELYRDLYDSCLNKGLLPLIKQYNTLMLQDVSTSVCGYYCVLFANLRASGRSFAHVVRHLSSCAASALDRDNFVVRCVYALLSNCSNCCNSSRLRLPKDHSGLCIRQCCSSSSTFCCRT